jgi:hypothetical protein
MKKTVTAEQVANLLLDLTEGMIDFDVFQERFELLRFAPKTEQAALLYRTMESGLDTAIDLATPTREQMRDMLLAAFQRGSNGKEKSSDASG